MGWMLKARAIRLYFAVEPHESSVTRFGEILPLWQKFTIFCQICDCLFPIWQNAEPTLANLWHYWANFHCCKWPKIEKWSNHLVTLHESAAAQSSHNESVRRKHKTLEKAFELPAENWCLRVHNVWVLTWEEKLCAALLGVFLWVSECGHVRLRCLGWRRWLMCTPPGPGANLKNILRS